MCTASWLKRGEALHLFFNRDELRTREPALPPVARNDRGVSWLAPLDGRAHGTWIGAAEHGLVLALLNRSDGVRPAGAESRGLLIPSLIDAGDGAGLIRALSSRPLDRFAPFRLLGLWRSLDDGVVASWDGRRLDLDQVDAEVGLLCSSGLGDERATASRGEVWRRMRGAGEIWNVDSHRRFHRDHFPEPSAWSVCVHRPEAVTVSFTEVEQTQRAVSISYRPGPPCEPAATSSRRLDFEQPPAD